MAERAMGSVVHSTTADSAPSLGQFHRSGHGTTEGSVSAPCVHSSSVRNHDRPSRAGERSTRQCNTYASTVHPSGLARQRIERNVHGTRKYAAQRRLHIQPHSPHPAYVEAWSPPHTSKEKWRPWGGLSTRRRNGKRRTRPLPAWLGHPTTVRGRSRKRQRKRKTERGPSWRDYVPGIRRAMAIPR